jgi:hypothetical protein
VSLRPVRLSGYGRAMRRIVFLFSVLVALVGLSTAVLAEVVDSPYEDSDPNGDSAYLKGDIEGIRVVYVENGPIRLIVDARQGSSPTSPVWNDPRGRTAIRWTVHSVGPDIDLQVLLRSTADGPDVRIREFDGTPVGCQETFDFLPGGRYRIEFGSQCVGATSPSFWTKVSFTFNPIGPAPASTDRVPDAGSTPVINPD